MRKSQEVCHLAKPHVPHKISTLRYIYIYIYIYIYRFAISLTLPPKKCDYSLHLSIIYSFDISLSLTLPPKKM